MRRVLITGASGFIGRHLAKLLLGAGFEVHSVGRGKAAVAAVGTVCHVADLLDTTTHQPLIAAIRPTHLLHVAWYAEHGKFWQAVENVQWLRSSIALTETFFRHGGERFLGTGTCAEYDWRFGVCNESTTPIAPASLYGEAKHALAQCIAALASAYGGSHSWARIFYPYGPHEPAERLTPSVIRSILAGEPARCTHGKQYRDFLFVEDVASALVSILESNVTGAINIGSGQPVQIREVAHRIGQLLGREDLVALNTIAETQASAPMVVADVSRLHDEVGWSRRISLDEGLLRSIDWSRRAAADEWGAREIPRNPGT